MIQIAAFHVPDEQNDANKFLTLHKPAGPIQFNKDTIFVFYDDGIYPKEYEVADIQELISNQRQMVIQLEIAIEVAKHDTDRFHPKKNKEQFEAAMREHRGLTNQLANLNLKLDFLKKRKEEVEART